MTDEYELAIESAVKVLSDLEDDTDTVGTREECQAIRHAKADVMALIGEDRGKLVVGLPDTQGGVCWLAGFDSDPTRYYTARCALRFDPSEVLDAIKKAKETHPNHDRTYIVIPASEIRRYNVGR